MITQGFTPLHLAASQGDLSLVKFLTQFGCSIYCKDKASPSGLGKFIIAFLLTLAQASLCFILYFLFIECRKALPRKKSLWMRVAMRWRCFCDSSDKTPRGSLLTATRSATQISGLATRYVGGMDVRSC